MSKQPLRNVEFVSGRLDNKSLNRGIYRISAEEKNYPNWHLEGRTKEGQAQALEDQGETGLSKRIKEYFESVLRRCGLKIPSTSVDVFLSRHNTQEDASRARPLIDDTDIVFIEWAGWDYEIRMLFQKVADGNENARNKLTRVLDKIHQADQESGSEFVKGMIQNLFNSKKKIGLIDVGYSDQMFVTYADEKMRDSVQNSEIDREKDFFQLIDEVREKQSHKLGFEVVYREQKMIENFSREIKRLCKQYPSLKRKDQLKVVMPLGAIHTRVARGLQEQGIAAKNKMSHGPTLCTSHRR